MKKILLTLSLLVLAACSGDEDSKGPQENIKSVVYSENFELKTPTTYHWVKGGQEVTRGTLVVLKVDKEAFVPRESKEPVLYVGPWPAQKLNSGHTGHIVAFVPRVSAKDLARVWVGKEALHVLRALVRPNS